MCAIFGVLFNNNYPNTYRSDDKDDILNHIIASSLERGRDGFGWSSTNETAYRSIKTIKYPLIDYDLKADGSLIGNVRAEPTTEYVKHKTNHDQQPYTCKNWTIVHNGTIANDKELRSKFASKVKTDIDSAAIAEELNRNTKYIQTPSAIWETFKTAIRKLDGSYAILAQYKHAPRSLFVACNYKPIYYACFDNKVYFASSAEFFPVFLYPKEIKPYTIQRFRYINNKLRIESTPVNNNYIKKPRTLVICSGGMDSTVAAAECIKEGHDVTLYHYRYGCRAEMKELTAINDIANYFNCDYKIMTIPIYDKTDSNLFNDSDIVGGEQGAEFAHEWVPARNLVMLSLAVAYAEAKGFDYIALGNNLEEAGAYPDNEPEFINRYNKLLPYAIGANKHLEIIMPVGNLMKHEIVKLGLSNNAPLHLTWSCYRHGEYHCGECGPCYMRKIAFDINATPEVIKYEHE